jgi:hypothetical protein
VREALILARFGAERFHYGVAGQGVGQRSADMIEVTYHDSVALLRMANGKANVMSLEFCERL